MVGAVKEDDLTDSSAKLVGGRVNTANDVIIPRRQPLCPYEYENISVT